ncbi:MAG: L,D-transpeptidase [Acidobacteria bacterium]|nr:L,D-transpeptidase [Acidobacteriota bacterium]
MLVATSLGLAAGFVALRMGARRGEGPPSVELVAVPEDSRSIEALAASLDKDVKALRSQNKRLEEKMAKVRPHGLYVVIDVGADKLFVMQDEKILREAVCSTGSGVRLADPNTPRSWVFDTPRGELTVRGKTTDPIWVKPDWAFIETGEGIPHSRDDRMEEGVLGDYALDLGQGYLIHGTLFERALGLHVTHGCVRMGSKDLEYLFKTVKPGTKVYIV